MILPLVINVISCGKDLSSQARDSRMRFLWFWTWMFNWRSLTLLSQFLYVWYNAWSWPSPRSVTIPFIINWFFYPLIMSQPSPLIHHLAWRRDLQASSSTVIYMYINNTQTSLAWSHTCISEPREKPFQK